MTKADLLALAARVEAAQGADRELDMEVDQAAGQRNTHLIEYVDGKSQRVPWNGGGHGVTMECPRYTAYLDAAASLVPEGWAWSVRRMYPGGSVHDPRHTGEAFLDRWKDRDFRTQGATAVVRVVAATPALALTAAALRAMAEEAPDA